MRISDPKTRFLYGCLVVIILAGSVSSALGRDLTNSPAISEQQYTGYVVAQVYYENKADLDQLAAFLDIWEVDQDQGYLVALLSPGRYAQLKNAGYTLIIDQEKTAILTPRGDTGAPSSIDTIPYYPCYRTVEETYSTLTSLADDYPQLAELIDIGDSWEKVTPDGLEGYNIYVLRLTNEQLGVVEEKPTFFLMTEIHAREYVTAETATRFAEHLLLNYNRDADITWLLDHYRVYILTMTNPDGRKHAEAGILWRKNTNISFNCINDADGGVDLNRNHSFHWGGASSDPCAETFQGPSPVSEPETQALQDFVLTLFPDQRGPDDTDAAPVDATGLFISLHSYSELILWPWGWTGTDAPNHTQLQTLGRRMAYFNQYEPQQGYDLYVTTGTSDDWAYGELGIAAYTYEMGSAFFQDCSSFEKTIYPQNLQALLYAYKTARLPYMTPSGPRVINLSLAPLDVIAGTPVTLTATADDDLYFATTGIEPTQAIHTARYSIDAPSWSTGTITYPVNPLDGVFNAETEALSIVIDTTWLPAGPHIVFVEAMDKDGNWGVPSAIFLNIQGLIDTFIPLIFNND